MSDKTRRVLLEKGPVTKEKARAAETELLVSEKTWKRDRFSFGIDIITVAGVLLTSGGLTKAIVAAYAIYYAVIGAKLLGEGGGFEESMAHRLDASKDRANPMDLKTAMAVAKFLASALPLALGLLAMILPVTGVRYIMALIGLYMLSGEIRATRVRWAAKRTIDEAKQQPWYPQFEAESALNGIRIKTELASAEQD